MSEPEDDLFRRLEKEMQGERATATVEHLRAIFRWYVTEKGPISKEEKVQAVMETNPDLDLATAEMMAQTHVIADGILLAVGVYLARAE